MNWKCKWCGKSFDHGEVFPSSWGLLRRECAKNSITRDDCYCSEKCRSEAEAGSGKSDNNDSSSSAPSAPEEPMLSPGCAAVLGKVVTGVVILMGLMIVLAVIFAEDPEDINNKDQMMKKWAEHLEKRCDAFAEGLCAEGVDERGLKGYTWEEWMEFKRKELGDKATTPVKEEKVVDMHQKWVDYLNTKHSLGANGMSEDDLHSVGFDELSYSEFQERFKDKNPPTEEDAKVAMEKKRNEKKKNMPVRKASNTASYQVTGKGRNELRLSVTSEYGTRSDAWQGAIRAAVESAVIRFVSNDKRVAANKARFENRLKDVTESDIDRYDTLKDMQEGEVFTVKISAELSRETLAKKFNDIFPGVFPSPANSVPANSTVANSTSATGVKKEAKGQKTSPNRATTSRESDDEQQNDDKKHASAKSKVIGVVVEGKGKTRDAAVRYAIHEAVWRTVKTWVDSKERIEANKEQVVAIVKRITEADVAKFEVMDTRQRDGKIEVKVRVSVSKKKISPKFASVFPDVFGNE